MELTTDQIISMAPDSKAVSAGQKLAVSKSWPNAGRDEAAVWGECQGSKLYQTKVDLSALAFNCTCPSRKLPCKHVLGLLFLAVNSPADVPAANQPEWVAEWLEKRAATANRRAEKQQQTAAKPADPQAQAKRIAKRHANVIDGLERLDLWLDDLARNGLAGLELQSPAFWRDQAKRLVDAQARALATRVQHIGEIPGSGSDWPKRLLAELGRLALLSHAYQRVDELDAPLQADVRQLVGWTYRQEELAEQGDAVSDEWLVLGQCVEDEEQVRVQRNWLIGAQTDRSALVLQFSAAGQPFPESIVPGTCLEGDLVFYPGAVPQRAQIQQRRGEVRQISQRPPGDDSIEAFLQTAAEMLARQPWLDRFLCPLRDVHIVPQSPDAWFLCDQDGQALPLAGAEQWLLLALSGGKSVDVAAEWDGQQLRPLGVFTDGNYCPISAAPTGSDSF